MIPSSTRAGALCVSALRFLLVLAVAAPLGAQSRDTSLLTVERIFGTREFAGQPFGPTRWLDDSTYTAVEPAASGRGNNLMRIDAASGRKTVLVGAELLRTSGQQESLDVEEYEWSADRKRLLVFTNSARVWRANT